MTPAINVNMIAGIVAITVKAFSIITENPEARTAKITVKGCRPTLPIPTPLLYVPRCTKVQREVPRGNRRRRADRRYLQRLRAI